ncbi:MAG: hypothetical protein L0Y54_12015, partial [Sporichthyaceae bacterium]|nr:hypothetical protein [Sporichthyaceae bacterium]
MLGIGAVIAILLLMLQAIRTIVLRRGTPLLEALEGLARMAVITALGVALLNALAVASDALTTEIMELAFGNRDELVDRLGAVLVLDGGTGLTWTAVLLFSLIAFLVGLVQGALLFVRQAAIPIQAMLIPIAAAGQVGSSGSRQWSVRLWTSIVALIAYKPMAALIIAVGFAELEGGNDIADVIRGVVTLVLSVIALPALIRLLNPIV